MNHNTIDGYFGAGYKTFQDCNFDEAFDWFTKVIHLCRQNPLQYLNELAKSFRFCGTCKVFTLKTRLWPAEKFRDFRLAVCCFQNSLQYCDLTLDEGFENVEIITNVIWSEVKNNQGFFNAQVTKLTTPLIDRLSTMQSSFGSQGKLQKRLEEIRTLLCEQLLWESEELLSKANLRECWQALYQANLILKISKANTQQTRRFVALKNLYNAKTLLRSANEETNGQTKKMYFQQLLSLLAEAESMVEKHDTQLCCWIQVEAALVLLSVGNSALAKEKLEDAVNAGSILGFSQHEWFTKASFILRDLKNAEKVILEQNRKLELSLAEIRSAFEAGLHVLVALILEKYPPKHISGFRKQDCQNLAVLCREKATKRTALLKLVKLYHTDKIQVEVHGSLYKKIIEEIVKCLNVEFNKQK